MDGDLAGGNGVEQRGAVDDQVLRQRPEGDVNQGGHLDIDADQIGGQAANGGQRPRGRVLGCREQLLDGRVEPLLALFQVLQEVQSLIIGRLDAFLLGPLPLELLALRIGRV